MKISITVLALFLAFSASAFAASGQCLSDAPPAARFAAAYLSILERGGLNYDPYENHGPSGRTLKQICQELNGFAITDSKTNPGYVDVTLEFPNERCVIAVKTAFEGKKIAASREMFCEAK